MVITISGLRYRRHPTTEVLTVGTWFTYAVMQIFFGGFSGLDKPATTSTSKAGT